MNARHNLSDRMLVVINYFVLGILFVLITYPLIYVLSASISNPMAVSSGRMWLWPVDITTEGYRRVLENDEIWIGYRNTIFYTVIGTAYNLALTLPCAYALSRKTLKGRSLFTGIFLFTMFFNGGLIPTYFLNKSLNLINTIWVLIIPTGASVINIIIARTYYSGSIPVELEEAAYIEGCSVFRCFISIIMPLSKPIIAIIILYCAVGHWNSYFSAMVYLTNRKIYPLQLFLREILVQQQMTAQMMAEGAVDTDFISEQIRIAEIVKYSTMIVSALPLLIVYPFLQKFFVKGMMIGSLKD